MKPVKMTDTSKLFVNLLELIKLISFNSEHVRFIRQKFAIKLQLVSLIKSVLQTGPFGNNNDDQRITKYWPGKTSEEVIEEADVLFKNNKYLEVYELLNRLKFRNNPEVHWRLSRALFKLSCQHQIDEVIRKEMINEAYEIMVAALQRDDQSSTVHKWMAIVMDRKNGMDGIEVRMKNCENVKRHLIKCCELDPADVTAQYLLGRWCYEMSNLTWFQRMISKFLYGQPPQASYEEANKYLSKVEDLQPRFYLQNTYLLAKTCLKLGQNYRAKYYFGVVANLPAAGDYEQQCVADARKMLRKLAKYSLEKNALFYEYPFGNTAE